MFGIKIKKTQFSYGKMKTFAFIIQKTEIRADTITFLNTQSF